MDNNRFGSIPTQPLEIALSLKILHMFGNMLDHIPANAFYSLTHLKKVAAVLFLHVENV